MSKDFEAEYREYQNLNVPDLWSRIEAGIDAEEEKKSEQKKVVKFPIWKTATIVAACFAVIICIPSLGIMMLASGGSKSTNEIATETSTECEMEETDSEEWTEDIAADCATESTAEMPESAENESAAEREQLDVSISKVEELEGEIRYTAMDIDTEEEIIIIQEPDMPRMKVGNTYPVCVIKNGDIYYFEALVVE